MWFRLLRWSVLLFGVSWGLGACGASKPPSNVYAESLSGPCTGLFGRPSKTTGLSTEECSPSCSCGEQSWEPPTYNEAWVADLRKWKLTNPPAELLGNPYANPPAETKQTGVCAMLPSPDEPDTYSLQNYGSVNEAEEAGARVTHFGPCGLCSSLENLAVYMANPDLTEPVRNCALKGLRGDDEAALQCLIDIGFDRPCAQIWFYNTVNTRKVCLKECLTHLKSTHHTKDGKLNPCIQCDEDKSGPVFKIVSGRTRRNSGLASALCRPCETVKPISHRYRDTEPQ